MAPLQKFPFVYHQHVKHDLQHMHFEYFGGRLQEEEMERIGGAFEGLEGDAAGGRNCHNSIVCIVRTRVL